MSSFESSNQYLIERFLSSELSRFSSNFKIGTWDQIIVRSNSDTLFPKTYDKNYGNQVSVFTIKERLLRLFKCCFDFFAYLDLGNLLINFLNSSIAFSDVL